MSIIIFVFSQNFKKSYNGAGPFSASQIYGRPKPSLLTHGEQATQAVAEWRRA
jgi:hypothetical protein